MSQKGQTHSRLTELDIALRPTSAPMPKSTSSAHDAGSKDALNDAPAASASAYGTRSRNRTGGTRPNYAEDSIDTDVFDDVLKGSDQKKTRTASAASDLLGDGVRSGGGLTKKGASNDDPSPAIAISHPSSKDQPHTASSGAGRAAASATNGTSKKRKAAALQPVKEVTPTSASSKRPVTVSRNPGGGSSSSYVESNMMSFENCNARPHKGRLISDDGTELKANDHVYLVSEPPGEPYYLGRIMEFLHANNDPASHVDAVRINWYYRPKDIGRKVNDTRVVFATMHSDISPLTALRGKCQIRHKAEISNIDEYRKTSDCFWYERLYDRYIQKNYDLIPTSQIVNVPAKVKKVLDERWKYVLVEQGRGKELTSAVKSCKRCSGYCASNDSVDCAVCQNTYHMNCVKPPLLKKPSRGFAWSCAACSRAQERKLEARNTPNVLSSGRGLEDDEVFDDEDDEMQVDSGDGSAANGADDQSHQPTPEQVYQASLWPYRYLGMHCKVEDALDLDDRIYPRASSRIGPRHQALVLPWPGRPVELVKPLEVKRPGKKDSKLSKEVQAALETERVRRENRPKWVQDEPSGYVARGEDSENGDPECTATMLWKPPPSGVSREDVEGYMEKAKRMAGDLFLPERSTNLQHVAMDVLYSCGFDVDKALELFPTTPRSTFDEPELSPAEQKKFEEGVSKYGSELYSVTKHVGDVPHGTIVRYYYTWKKTTKGRQIWGNYAGRKGKKEARKTEAAAARLLDDVADPGDDSAYDADKAAEKKKAFVCKFCETKSSRWWRRAPTLTATLVTESHTKGTKDKGGQYIVALCRRCAELWRRYAVQWEDIDEVAKKVAQAGSRAWKRRQDEELLKELNAAKEPGNGTASNSPDRPATPSSSSEAPPAVATPPIQNGEPPRKRLKATADKEEHKKPVEKPAPPPEPEMPKARVLPCFVCGEGGSDREGEGEGEGEGKGGGGGGNAFPLLNCRGCRLSIHPNCYGVTDSRSSGKWTCDMCSNDRNPQASIDYKCVLCPVDSTEHDFVGTPTGLIGKKKPTEREKQELQQAQKAAEFYRKRQEENNRPVNPREALKRTADNNWIHVTCAVWTPEVRFGSAKALFPVEGVPSIMRSKYDLECKLCHKFSGAAVRCEECDEPVHVECARQNGGSLGFELNPVKGTRRDQLSTVSIGTETGTMSAVVRCPSHDPGQLKAVHHPYEHTDERSNALQLYVQTFKQADLTLTGTVRKANLIATAAKTAAANAPLASTGVTRQTSATTLPPDSHSENVEASLTVPSAGDKICMMCGADVSPKWFAVDESQQRELTNGYYESMGAEAQRFLAQRRFQCHKCRKSKRQPRQPPLRSPTPPPAPSAVPTLAPPQPPQPSLVAMETPVLGITPVVPVGHSAVGVVGSHPYAWPPPMQAPAPQHPQAVAGSAVIRDPQYEVQTSHAVHAGHVDLHATPHQMRGPVTAHSGPLHLAPRPPPSASPPHAANATYNEWRPASSAQHGSSPQINGVAPPLSQQPSIGGLSALRPPNQPSLHQNGQAPMMHLGISHSPSRHTTAPPSNPPPPSVHPYGGHYLGHAPVSSHARQSSITNGVPVPVTVPPSRAADPFAQGHLSGRATYGGSPPSSPPALPSTSQGPPPPPDNRRPPSRNAMSLSNLIS